MVWFTLPPLGAFVLSHAVSLAAAQRSGYRYFTVAQHQRWDSAFYEQIANGGYHMTICNTDPSAFINTNAWCGDVSWFPLYGWLIRICEAITGLSVEPAALLVAELATLTMFVLFWWLLTTAAPAEPTVAGAAPPTRPRVLSLLALAALLPAGIYFDANFPMSLTVAATLACLGLTLRRRWVPAGLAGAAAAMAYPVGLAAGAAAVVVVAVLTWREHADWRPLLGRATLVGGLSAAGTILVFAIMQLSVGHWNAFFLADAKYGGQSGQPVQTFLTIVEHGQYSPMMAHYGPSLVARFTNTVRVEMVVSFGLVLACIATVTVAILRRRCTALDAGLLAFAVITFLLPLSTGTQVSQYRSHALLIPALLTLRRLPPWLLIPLAIPAAILAYKMATLFYYWLLM